MFTVATLNLAMDAVLIDEIQLHSDVPGSAGTDNQVSGGSGAINFGAASGGVRSQTTAVDIDVPAGVVSHYSLWEGATLRKTGAFDEPETFANPGVYRVENGNLSVTDIS